MTAFSGLFLANFNTPSYPDAKWSTTFSLNPGTRKRRWRSVAQKVLRGEFLTVWLLRQRRSRGRRLVNERGQMTVSEVALVPRQWPAEPGWY
jgi:hypothetical protein